eukprot:COSAG05_NODE_462_length_9561_cov_5.923378_3_plen_38_part_00
MPSAHGVDVLMQYGATSVLYLHKLKIADKESRTVLQR